MASPDDEDPEAARRSGDLLLTIGKLAGIIIPLLVLQAWVYTSILDSKITALRLQLSEQFAQKAEAISRTEYELRHKSLEERDDRGGDRMKSIEDRLTAVEHRMTK